MITAQAQPSSSDNKVFVNPISFTELDTPLIVLVDDLQGFLGWGIKSHTKGNYCHAMILYHPGILTTQNWLFQQKTLDEYLKDRYMLKFWRIKNLTSDEKSAILNAIGKRLALPWYKRTYDFIGTFVGQLVNVKWIQNPWQEFCSEEVNDDYIKPVARCSSMNIIEPSPAELDRIFKLCPDLMECLGYCWKD